MPSYVSAVCACVTVGSEKSRREIDGKSNLFNTSHFIRIKLQENMKG